MRIRVALSVVMGAAVVPGMALGGTNTKVGDFALDNLTSGIENSAFGSNTGEQITTTSDNTIVGFEAMAAAQGAENTAVGAYSTFFNFGGANTAVGFNSLGGGTGVSGTIWEFDGSYNVAVGAFASAAPGGINEAYYDTSVGAFALYQNKASYNTAVGGEALYTNSTGTYNTAVGFGAMAHNDMGSNNTALGYYSLVFSSGSDDTGIGYLALFNNQANGSTAVGSQALYSNTTGQNNTATGNLALYSNTTGHENTAFGEEALYGNTTGQQNMGFGKNALHNATTGSYNSAMGYSACWSCISGNNNVGYGFKSLYHLDTGSNNIAIGSEAGYLTTGSNNIDVGNQGTGAESGVIRIGTPATQTATYIAGISTTQLTGAAVYVNSSGQLGVLPSSERYKTDVRPMQPGAEKLAELRPVTFHLKSEPYGALQYGLIAEDVAKVYPDLVIRDAEGTIQGVRYDELAPLLLKQVQTLQRTAGEQARILGSQAEEIAALRAGAAEVVELKARLLRLERVAVESVVAAR